MAAMTDITCWALFDAKVEKSSPQENGRECAVSDSVLCLLISGFWTIQNFVRPLRFSVALAMAPLFEKGISAISRATGFSRRNAFGVYLFILGSVTSILVFGSIFVFAGTLAYARV